MMMLSKLSQLPKGCSRIQLRSFQSGPVGFFSVALVSRPTMPWSACAAIGSSLQPLMTCAGNDPTIRFVSSTAAAAPKKVERIPIPSNLHLDPKSSFAARVVVPPPRASRTKPPANNKAATRTSKDEDGGGKDSKDTAQRAAAAQGIGEDYDSDAGEYEDDGDEYDDDDDDYVSVLEREVEFVTPLPDRLRATVQDVRDGCSVGTLWLDEAVFGRDPIRIDLLKRADYHRAKKRGRRNAATKTISQVSGSGRKLRQQKGTGRARVGHGRPAHFRGGAKAHGPKNATDYGHTKLNKKVRKQALCHALSQKLKENNVILLNDLNVPSHKTSELARILQVWNVGGEAGASALLLDHYFPSSSSSSQQQQDERGAAKSSSAQQGATEPAPPSFRGVPANLHVASRNISKVEVGNAHKASVYELLRKEKLIVTLEALAVLERRLRDY
jgi:large subunit ribosomal protein L4